MPLEVHKGFELFKKISLLVSVDVKLHNKLINACSAWVVEAFVEDAFVVYVASTDCSDFYFVHDVLKKVYVFSCLNVNPKLVPLFVVIVDAPISWVIVRGRDT